MVLKAWILMLYQYGYKVFLVVALQLLLLMMVSISYYNAIIHEQVIYTLQ